METAVLATIRPWSSIWTHPREAIQKILDSNSSRHVLFLAAVSGVAQGFQRASDVNAGNRLELPAIVAIAGIVGATFGVVSLYIGAILLRVAGKWIGGKATASQIRVAMAWAGVPSIGLAISWLLKIAIFGRELFSDITPQIESDQSLATAFLGFLLVDLTLAVWAMVLTLKCLGQAQGFSAWKALGNMILAFLLGCVPLVLVVIGLVIAAQ